MKRHTSNEPRIASASSPARVAEHTEEMMKKRQSRFGLGALALVSMMIFGSQSAFALQNTPRAEASGWICPPNPNAGAAGCAEVKFGVTAHLDSSGNNASGRFDYFNKFTGYQVHGRITSFSPVHPANCAAYGAPNGAPAVTVVGVCDDGGSCTFQTELVDATKSGKGDWVCNFNMTGADGRGNSEPAAGEVFPDPGQPLQKGNINIH